MHLPHTTLYFSNLFRSLIVNMERALVQQRVGTKAKKSKYKKKSDNTPEAFASVNVVICCQLREVMTSNVAPATARSVVRRLRDGVLDLARRVGLDMARLCRAPSHTICTMSCMGNV